MNNLQIKQYLQETRMELKHMIRTVHINNNVLSYLAKISDLSYGWLALQEYLGLMQA